MKANTLLEGFVLTTPANTINDLQGVTATNRGRIVAVDLISSDTVNAPWNLSLIVGGQEVVSNMPNRAYEALSYPNGYSIIPLEINDGQTFGLTVDNSVSPATVNTNVIFLREGAKRSYLRNAVLSSYILSQGLFTFPVNSFTSFEGTIPKNRGKCIGFEIVKNNIALSPEDQNSALTFSVGGTELILNAPYTVFDPAITRPYTKFFTDLEAGSTWRLQMNTSAGQPRLVNVLFYFEENGKESK